MNILITGGNSMLGHHLADLLFERGDTVYCPGRIDANLLNYGELYSWDKDLKIDGIIHLATYSGNVQFNQKYPYDTYWKTSQMALNVMDHARHRKVKKILSILSSCTYPNIDDGEISESTLWNGLPHCSIESHGLAKRTLHSLSKFVKQQYNINASTCVVSNMFGPWDSFSVDKTKVVGGLITKFVEAKKTSIPPQLWGTGKALRELLYVKDAAQLIVRCFDLYNEVDPINIGTPYEVSIKDLATKIAAAVGYDGEIIWLESKGDGQLRKKLDLTKMNQLLLTNSDFCYTHIDDAITQTVRWYLENKDVWTK